MSWFCFKKKVSFVVFLTNICRYVCREGDLTEEEKALREYELSYTKAPIASLHNLGQCNV